MATTANQQQPPLRMARTPTAPLEICAQLLFAHLGQQRSSSFRGRRLGRDHGSADRRRGRQTDLRHAYRPEDSTRQEDALLAQAIYFESAANPRRARPPWPGGAQPRAQRHLSNHRLGRRRLSGPQPAVRLPVLRPLGGQVAARRRARPWAVATRIARDVVSGANYDPKVDIAVTTTPITSRRSGSAI